MLFIVSKKWSALPDWIIWVRRAQALLNALVLALTAAAAAKFLRGADPSYLLDPCPGFGFAWFAFAWTLFYLLAAVFWMPICNPQWQPLIISMVLEILSCIWWLVTFALLADASQKINVVYDAIVGYYGHDDYFKTALSLTQASAVLGAAEFVLFVVTTAVIIQAFIKHQQHSSPGHAMTTVEQLPKEAQPNGAELSV